MTCSFQCLSLLHTAFLKGHESLDLGPTLPPVSHIITVFVSKDPVSKQSHTLGSWEDMDFMGGGHSSMNKGSFSIILGSGDCKDVLKEEDTTIARRDISKARHSQESPQSRSSRGSKRESEALLPYPDSLPPVDKHDIEEPSQESRLRLPFPAWQTEYTKVGLEPRDNILIISMVVGWRRKMNTEKNCPMDLASVLQPNKCLEEMLSCLFVCQANKTFQHSGQLLGQFRQTLELLMVIANLQAFMMLTRPPAIVFTPLMAPLQTFTIITTSELKQSWK